MRFREDFWEAYSIGCDRVLLARVLDPGLPCVENYRKRFRDFMSEDVSFSKCVSSVLGYALGTYTTFCPTQFQLDNFDRRVELEV